MIEATANGAEATRRAAGDTDTNPGEMALALLVLMIDVVLLLAG